MRGGGRYGYAESLAGVRICQTAQRIGQGCFRTERKTGLNIAEHGMSAPNLLCVCVDRLDGQDFTGKIWHQYDDEPVEYRTVVQMLQSLDALYDKWDFPQRSTEARMFKKKSRGKAVPAEREGENAEMDEKRLNDKAGEVGTFLVKVRYRQNSTWQGEVVWAEKNQKQYFRSALELLKLMDSALN